MTSLDTPLSTAATEFAYLALGDLCEVLEQSNDTCNCRWLIAILDHLLTHRPVLEQIVLLTGGMLDQTEQDFYAKLQRLRDRVAHRKPYLILGNEVRCDLLKLFGTAFRR